MAKHAMKRLGLWVSIAVGSGCSEDTALVPDLEPAEMAVGEKRAVEVRFMRFDVQGFEKSNDLEQLRTMPRRVLEDIWLLDLDITQLMINSLEKLRAMSPEELAEQPLPARNMHRLLTMTPDNAVLMGTNLEELVALSASVGIPPAKALGNLLDVPVTGDFIPPEIVAEVMLDEVVASHPAAQFRRGPVNEDHPDGLYPVAPRSIPLTLADVVTNFENLADRFGPTGDHPGFLLDAHGVSVVEEDFQMISKVSANALPFKGLDLTNGDVASVNSVGGQVEDLHDFSDPDWLRLEGLVEDPRVEQLTFSVKESDGFVAGGTSREPAGQGNSPVWDLPGWEFEALIARMSQQVAAGIPAHCDSYELATGVEAFTACIDDDGWVTLETFNNVGSPPAPTYLWDMNLEIAQARLHDGGLAEGEADIELSVTDVPVGVPPEQLVQAVRDNIQANPSVLREFAELITDSTEGDADFYYYRSQDGRDWLYFVTDTDLRKDDSGDPVRPYDYEKPGFYADQNLTNKVSSRVEIDNDAEHEKLQVSPGDVVYVQDDRGWTYEVYVGDKPSRAKLNLEVTRLR